MLRTSRLAYVAAVPLFSLAACAATVEPDPMDVDPTPENGVDPPFAVSSIFAPSGYMGDGTTGTAVLADQGGEFCKPRPTGARGDCYRFTYAADTQLWAGVYWQFPPNNWGSAEGKKVAPGASQVSFYAAGAVGGEILKITVGGIKDVTLPNSDALKADATVTLTPEMTQYTVALGSQPYDKVIGGFSWATNYPEGTNPATAAPIVFYLDDIVWE